MSQFCGSLSGFDSRDVVTSPAIAASDVDASMVEARSPTRKIERSFMVSSPCLSVMLRPAGAMPRPKTLTLVSHRFNKPVPMQSAGLTRDRDCELTGLALEPNLDRIR